MREAPTFADSVQSGVVGDDPLGLAPMNERLYNHMFPGFNNVVRYIRVYSALCWMSRQVALALERGDASTAKQARALYKHAIEKVELVLVWANRGTPGLAGNTRKFPDGDASLEFKFETFGFNQATLFEAVTYRPSLTSLQFLEPREHETYGCLDHGEALAQAFEEGVESLPGYRWLKAPERLSGRPHYVAELAPGFDVNKPSTKEQVAFLASFFPAQRPADSNDERRDRWLSLRLMLKAVDAASKANEARGASRGASPDEVRACMAAGMSVDGQSVVDAHDSHLQACWSVLQVRQLQRLCLEALYCVVEQWIAQRETDGDGRSLQECLTQLSQSWSEHLHEALHGSIGRLLSLFEEWQGTHATLYEAAACWEPEDAEQENEADVLVHLGRLSDKGSLVIADEGQCEAVADALTALAFCAVEAANLARSKEALSVMKEDNDPCSLSRLSELVLQHRDTDLGTFLRHVLKEWVVLRHFEVAGSRTMERLDGKNRFRFVMGDYGLERFDKAARLPRPGISSDKLDHALMLCEQGGLLVEESERYRLTAKGRARLQ